MSSHVIIALSIALALLGEVTHDTSVATYLIAAVAAIVIRASYAVHMINKERNAARAKREQLIEARRLAAEKHREEMTLAFEADKKRKQAATFNTGAQ